MLERVRANGFVGTLHRGGGCAYLSDLRYLDTKERFRLAGAVEQIPPGDYSLTEWNDALGYLAGGEPASSAGEAKQRLLLGLTRLRFQK